MALFQQQYTQPNFFYDFNIKLLFFNANYTHFWKTNKNNSNQSNPFTYTNWKYNEGRDLRKMMINNKISFEITYAEINAQLNQIQIVFHYLIFSIAQILF